MKNIFFYLAYIPIRFYARWGIPRNALVFLFEIHKRVVTLISDRASDYEGGVHPKHRLMQYHLFFTQRIKKGEKVLDIGSGRGYLANEMAMAGASVTGIEISQRNIGISNKLYQLPNLKFILGDAWKDIPKEKFDTAVISNVLEHIDRRVEFMKKIQSDNHPSRWLIRVPCFDRDWSVALAEELGLDSRLDDTHFIEYTDKVFESEMNEAGFKITHFEKQWGEIWAEVKPREQTE